MSSIPFPLKNHTDKAISALRSYLAGFKAGSDVIPLYVKGYTREMTPPAFPYFYVEKFSLLKDRERLESGLKTETAIVDDVPYVKYSSLPYKLTFVLEYADSNPVNYHLITEMLLGKIERTPFLILEYGNDKDELCPLLLENLYENEYSEISHRLFSLSLLIRLDPTLELVEAETIDTVIMNNITIEEEG